MTTNLIAIGLRSAFKYAKRGFTTEGVNIKDNQWNEIILTFQYKKKTKKKKTTSGRSNQ